MGTESESVAVAIHTLTSSETLEPGWSRSPVEVLASPQPSARMWEPWVVGVDSIGRGALGLASLLRGSMSVASETTTLLGSLGSYGGQRRDKSLVTMEYVAEVKWDHLMLESVSATYDVALRLEELLSLIEDGQVVVGQLCEAMENSVDVRTMDALAEALVDMGEPAVPEVVARITYGRSTVDVEPYLNVLANMELSEKSRFTTLVVGALERLIREGDVELQTDVVRAARCLPVARRSELLASWKSGFSDPMLLEEIDEEMSLLG